MNLLDTLVWLANFPVTNGYIITFIAASAILGCFMMARRFRANTLTLAAIREREGLSQATRVRPGTAVVGSIRRMLFSVLAIVMLVSFILSILATIGVPLTRSYIHANGSPTTGEIDGDWVSFTTNVGVEYTLPNASFTRSTYPDTRAYVGSDEPVVVRYLPSHPQAYVIDTTQLPQ